MVERRLPLSAGLALAALASVGGLTGYQLRNPYEPGDYFEPLDFEPPVYRRRPRAPIRKPVDPKKKAARKRQKKARMITRRQSNG